MPEKDIRKVPALCILRRILMTSARAVSAGRSHSNLLKPLPGPWPSLRSQLGKPIRDVSISHVSPGICISVGCVQSSAEWDIYAALLPYMTALKTKAHRSRNRKKTTRFARLYEAFTSTQRNFSLNFSIAMSKECRLPLNFNVSFRSNSRNNKYHEHL